MVWYTVVFTVFVNGNDRNSGKDRDALYERYCLTRTPVLLDILEISAGLNAIFIFHLIHPPNRLTFPFPTNGVDRMIPVRKGKEKKGKKEDRQPDFSVQLFTRVIHFPTSFLSFLPRPSHSLPLPSSHKHSASCPHSKVSKATNLLRTKYEHLRNLLLGLSTASRCTNPPPPLPQSHSHSHPERWMIHACILVMSRCFKKGLLLHTARSFALFFDLGGMQ